MESFIKKIFDGKTDDSVHQQFVKFSRGEFKDRALVSINKTANNYSISTSSEYANELVRNIANLLPGGKKVSVSGAIITTLNLKDSPILNKFLTNIKVSQFQGVKKYQIEQELDKEQIISICDHFSKAFIALSFKTSDTELKIKPKAPKSAKPKNKEEEPKADFCKIKTNNKAIVNMFLVNSTEFKRIDVKHDFIITEIDIPKNETDPAKMRELAVRKGKIVRYENIDGTQKKLEIPFKA